jgi:hypothetical protein
MKRELFIHFAFWFAFFVLISIFNNYLSLSYWPFWVGGLVGTLIPDIDHLIYVFFLSPGDLTSQRVNFLLRKKEVFRVVSLLYETRSERKNLVFHTFIFQLIFLGLTFFILSSSSSIFVRGLVLAFSIHTVVDQLADTLDLKNLNNWGKLFPFELNYKNSMLYISASFILVFVMGILM